MAKTFSGTFALRCRYWVIFGRGGKLAYKCGHSALASRGSIEGAIKRGFGKGKIVCGCKEENAVCGGEMKVIGCY